MLPLSKVHILVGALIASTALLNGCTQADDDQEVVAPDIIRPVKLFTVETQTAKDIRRFPGELHASQDADLAFRVGGQLKTLKAVEGQTVKKGDLLAQLDPKDFQLQVELAEANYRLAKATFSRVQAIYRQNATTQSQLDESRAALDQAENALEQAKNQLSYTQLTAPFDGVISNVTSENFQYVSATQPLIHLQNIAQLDVVFQLPEALIANIQSSALDYQPRVVIDVASQVEFSGRYKNHNTMPDNTTKAYDVTLSLNTPQSIQHLTLLPGMTANIDVDINRLLGTRSHILVPVEAVFEQHQNDASIRQVWVYNDNNRVTQRPVKVGILQDNEIEILEGLEDGDRIVSAGVHNLDTNTPVRPWTRERGL